MEKTTLVYIGAREYDNKRYYGYMGLNEPCGDARYFHKRLCNIPYAIGALIEVEVDGRVYRKQVLTGKFLDRHHPLFSQLVFFSLEEKAANLKLEAVKNANKKQVFNSYEPHLDKILNELKFLEKPQRKLVIQHLVSKLYETL